MDRELVDYFIRETNKKHEHLDARLRDIERMLQRIIGISVAITFFANVLFHFVFIYLERIK